VTEPDAPGGNRRRGVPASTYRLQVHADFPLDEAAKVAGYLADLGVTHAYSSPLLRSAEGSTHGYDTVDHAHIDEARGGREGFDRFVEALH
jgi:(1->4)-alpha-D-glucan 1-alpha-D-glucosylmutase